MLLNKELESSAYTTGAVVMNEDERRALEAHAALGGTDGATIASVLQALTPEERRSLLRLSPLRSWWALAVNWAIVFGAMALVAWAWPNLWLSVPAVIAALFLIGCRQLACAIVMHDAGHRAMFRHPGLNDWVGNWLGAYPIWLKMQPYRRIHFAHHTHTWTDDDPDIGLVLPFPITRASLRRKIVRDLTGRTAWKGVKYRVMRACNLGPFKARPVSRDARDALRGMLMSNAVLLGLLTLAGYPALYLLWPAAFMTTNAFVTRIRSIAEHAMSPDISHPLKNTRTTLARWWERLLLAPNRVNYHLEHHLMMTAPHYNLPRLHRLLRARGMLDDAEVAYGYPQVILNAASKPAAAPA